MLNRTICISLPKYAFKEALKQSKKAESILLQFSRWVPLIIQCSSNRCVVRGPIDLSVFIVILKVYLKKKRVEK